MSEFIVNIRNHQFDYSRGTFPSMAAVGGKLYVAYQSGGSTQVKIVMFQDNGGSEPGVTFASPSGGYRYPLVTADNANLYLVFMGDDGKFNIVRLDRDANGGIMPDWTKHKITSESIGSPDRMSVTFPTSTGIVMMWQDGAAIRIGSLLTP